MTDFRVELQKLLNRHSQENGSDTPDFLLADYLIACLATWNTITVGRDSWRGFLSPVQRLEQKALADGRA